jgi:lipopolysaccharide transport system ATP-binding protein
MPDFIIQSEQLGKSYLIGHQARRERYTALRDVLAAQAKSLMSTMRRTLRGQVAVAGDRIEEFWALRDVSFEVKQGEVVGIIGRNGAGKSTLLKILSRITEPSEGRVTLRGRVASLLEVGTGFHPELTGRENIYLNGAILGMSRAEIRQKFDEIVAFAEVEQFLDTPVKRYSSGMYVRLAFAVAAHLEPEILVVDEVLAVGDAEFQKKCLGKMQDVSRGGRTVIFVSHNMSAVQSLCARAILLQGGRLVRNGLVNEIVSDYLSSMPRRAEYVRTQIGRDCVYVERASVDVLESPERHTLRVSTEIRSIGARRISLDLRLRDSAGNPVGFAPVGSFNKRQEIELSDGTCRVISLHDISSIATGSYELSIDIAEPNIGYFDRAESCVFFEVVGFPRSGCYRRLEQKWSFGSCEIPYIDHTVVSLNAISADYAATDA